MRAAAGTNKGAKTSPAHPAGELLRAGGPGATHSTLTRLAKRGQASRLAAGLYVVDATIPLEQAARHHAKAIIEMYWPGAVLCARTAFSGGLPTDGVMYVTPGDDSARTVALELPGLRLVPVLGPHRLPGDIAIPNGLYMAGTARALIENMTVRGRPGVWRAGTAAVEDKIDELARHGGAGRIQKVLDELDVIAGSFNPAPVGHVKERLRAVLGSFSDGSRTPTTPVSARLAARLAGVPFDAHRIEMLTALAATLEAAPPIVVHASPPMQRWEWLPFFEAYFSNFIEGTEFSVEEARLIAVEGVMPVKRPADAHDVAATYRLVSDPVERTLVPHNAEEFLEIISRRHATLMAARSDKDPGEFKQVPNYAGGYQFVAPDLVHGTLVKGFDVLVGLIDPFSRAVAMMVLVTECHPFLDGNGRLARLMMNAELSVAGQVRVCIPTVFRNEYISSLSGFSNGAGTGQSLISVLKHAQRWTAEMDWRTFEVANDLAKRTNAYLDSGIAAANSIRLELPNSLSRD